MSTIAFDANGKRILTDILTSGYLRQKIVDKYEISIPSEIKKLCFEFWFIDICDMWDNKLYTKSKLEIGNQFLKASIMGCQRVSSGQYEWKLRLRDVSVCVGIVRDASKYYKDGYGGFWYVGGHFFYPEFGKIVTFKSFKSKIKPGITIGVKIDFELQSLYYSVDESEYVKAPYIVSENASYRLMVTIFKHDQLLNIELL